MDSMCPHKPHDVSNAGVGVFLLTCCDKVIEVRIPNGGILSFNAMVLHVEPEGVPVDTK